MLNVGFTGTRHGMSCDQYDAILGIVINERSAEAHHGCCVGADAGFHQLIRAMTRQFVVGHPGPGWPSGPLCARIVCDHVEHPAPYMARNKAIVDAVSASIQDTRDPGIMIAAPFEPTPQLRGGTWATIRMAIRALRAGKLRDLYVVGRDGKLRDHSGWRVS